MTSRRGLSVSEGPAAAEDERGKSWRLDVFSLDSWLAVPTVQWPERCFSQRLWCARLSLADLVEWPVCVFHAGREVSTM